MQFDAEDRPPVRLLPLQVESKDLEAWLLAKEPRSITWYNEIGREEYARAFTAAQTAGTDVADDLYFGMIDVVSRSGDQQDFEKLVVPVLKAKGWLGGDEGQIARRVRLIYDTNLRLGRAAGRWARIQETRDLYPYLRAFTVGDDRVRRPPESPDHDHTAWNGIILPVDHEFWTQYFPPLDFRCFLPGTRIEGAVKAGIRRWHSGKAIEVIMASGRRLSVTPDHPILTGRGWVVAQHVRVGDHALRHRGVIAGEGSVFGGDDDAPPRAEDLFKALSAHALALGEPSPLKLHDQAGGRQGKIDVVFADAKLAQECRSKIFREHGFIAAALGTYDAFGRLCAVQDGVGKANAGNARQASNLGLADAERGGNGGHRSIRGSGDLAKPSLHLGVPIARDLPRPPALPLHASRRLFDGLPLEQFGLGTSAQDDALFGELAGQGFAADSGLFGELVHAHAGTVLIDEIVEVREFDFSGHVYDFQTDEGVLAADSLIVHNCRCEVVGMSRSQLARYRGGVTSADDLAYRIQRIGPPVFAAPAAPLATTLSRMVEGTNADLMPGMPPVSPGVTETRGRALWDALVASDGTDAVAESLLRLFGLAA